jgi:Kinesin motor domain
MLGTEEKPGIMFLTLKDLFYKMSGFKLDRKYTIRVSFLEIYNE